MALQRLKEAAEKAKCELSHGRSRPRSCCPSSPPTPRGPKHLNTVLTRQKYESLTDDLLERTVEPCQRCLSDAGLQARADRRGAAGGRPDARAQGRPRSCARSSARSPTARSTPTRASPWARPSRPASSRARSRSWCSSTSRPHTLGIETKDGTFTPLIERNSTIPTRKSRVFTTVADNQTKVEVHVLQGESDMAAYNKSLAKFELTNIPPAPKGVPQIEVTLRDRRQRHRVRERAGPGHRPQPVDGHPPLGRPQPVRARHGSSTRRRVARAVGQARRRSRRRSCASSTAWSRTPCARCRPSRASSPRTSRSRILAAMERAKKARARGRPRRAEGAPRGDGEGAPA